MSVLTLDILRDFMKDLSIDKSSSDRQLIVQTGYGGMQLFNNAIKNEAEEQAIKGRRLDAEFKVSKMKVDNKITYEEWSNLKNMIKSPDLENLVMVESIIEHYT
jgi:hypothetical protein